MRSEKAGGDRDAGPEQLTVAQGTISLARYPAGDGTRRAWDAADALVLHHLAGSATQPPVDLSGSVVVVNDGSGALATAVALARVPAPHVSAIVSVSDSYLSQQATRANLERNAIDPAAVTMLSSFDPLPAPIDVLLVKVPTSLALLEDQLRRLAPVVRADAVIIGAAMTRHLHTSTLGCFERTIGPTTTSLAQKKARLVFATRHPALDAGPWPWPITYVTADGEPVVNHAGVFSAERLDIGTRFFLEHLPTRTGGGRVVDLGCGNGIVGVRMARDDPQATVTFVDESVRAVASAQETYRAGVATGHRLAPARFVVGHGLFDLATGPAITSGSVDLVLNNPPFHADHAVGDATAWQMFKDSREALRPGGELWVVGNRHLGYHAKLKRLFGSSELMASNPKFVVLRAIR